MIAANFDDEPVNIKVYIPRHAIDLIITNKLKHKQKELLHGDSGSFIIDENQPLELEIPAQDAVIWKFE